MARGLTPEELEQEIKAQRAALANTLESLSGKLDKSELWAEAATLAASLGRDGGRLALAAAKANPGRSAAIGAGAALALWGASRLMRHPEPAAQSRLSRLRHRAEDRLGFDRKDADSLVRLLKARLEALDLQRDAEERRRAARRKSALRAAGAPLAVGLGALVLGAAAKALRGKPAEKTEAETLAEELDDLAAAMEAAMPEEFPDAPFPKDRH